MKNDKGSQSLDVRIHFLQVSEVLSWKGLLRWLSGKESACLCRRCKRPGFDPWVGKISWRKKWKPTPVFLPGEVHGQRRLAGYYSPWGRKESDMTERMHARTHTHTHTVMKRMSIYPRSPWQYWGQWVDTAVWHFRMADGRSRLSPCPSFELSHTKAPCLTRRPVSLRPCHPCHWANSSTLCTGSSRHWALSFWQLTLQGKSFSI